MADRFFDADPPVEGGLVLRGDEARHLARVRRVAVGETVEVFDGRGTTYEARVEALGRDEVRLRVERTRVVDREWSCRLTLACAVPKGERFDWLIEKATELGVARFLPLLSARSVVDPRSAKMERLRRAVIEASKQCGRSRLMEVSESVRFEAWLAEPGAGPRFLADPQGPAPGSWPSWEAADEATLAIGPEGGYTPDEVERAQAAGCQVIGLGPTLLRIETAALVGAAHLLAALERARSATRSQET